MNCSLLAFLILFLLVLNTVIAAFGLYFTTDFYLTFVEAFNLDKLTQDTSDIIPANINISNNSTNDFTYNFYGGNSTKLFYLTPSEPDIVEQHIWYYFIPFVPGLLTAPILLVLFVVSMCLPLNMCCGRAIFRMKIVFVIFDLLVFCSSFGIYFYKLNSLEISFQNEAILYTRYHETANSCDPSPDNWYAMQLNYTDLRKADPYHAQKYIKYIADADVSAYYYDLEFNTTYCDCNHAQDDFVTMSKLTSCEITSYENTGNGTYCWRYSCAVSVEFGVYGEQFTRHLSSSIRKSYLQSFWMDLASVGISCFALVIDIVQRRRKLLTGIV